MPGFPSGFGAPGNGPLFFPPTESAVDLPLVDDDNDGWWSGIAAFTQAALTTALLAANASAQLAQPSQGPAWDQGEIAAAAPLGGTVSGQLIIRPIAWANAPLHWNDGNEFVAVASFAVDQSDYAVPGPWPVAYAQPPLYDAGEIAYPPVPGLDDGDWPTPRPWPVVPPNQPLSGDAEGIQLYPVPEDTAPPRFDVWPTVPPSAFTADDIIGPPPTFLNVTEDEFRPPQQQRGATTWLLQGTSGPTSAVAPPAGPFAGDDEPTPTPTWQDLPPHVIAAPWAWHSGNDIPNGLPEEPDWRAPTVWTVSAPRIVHDTDVWVPVQVLNPENDEWQNPVRPVAATFVVPRPFGWEQHENAVLVVFPLPPDEDFYRAGPEAVPPVVILPVWGYDQQETAQLSAITDGEYVLVIPPPQVGTFSVPAPWQWEQDPAFVSVPPEDDHFFAGPESLPLLASVPVYAYDQHEWIQQAAGPTEDAWQNIVRPVGLTFWVPQPWAGEQLEQAFGLVAARHLVFRDQSQEYYTFLDQSQSGATFRDLSTPVLGFEEDSGGP